MVGLLFAWGTTLQVSGAVIAKGQVQVSSYRTAVQHPVGGVVSQILAWNGDKVKTGDLLLRLDDTQLRSDLAAVEGELFEILANEARLLAELDDRSELSPHPILLEAAKGNPELQELLRRQQRQLDAHYKWLDTQVGLLEEQTKQVHGRPSARSSALDAKRQQLALSQNELDNSVQSLDKGIVTKTIVTTLQKDVIATAGEIGKSTAKIAELKAKASERETQDTRHSSGLEGQELGRAEGLGQQEKKLIESRNNLLYKLSKLDIKSPVSGFVHNSKVLGLQSVIEAAKPIMYMSRIRSRYRFRFMSTPRM